MSAAAAKPHQRLFVHDKPLLQVPLDLLRHIVAWGDDGSPVVARRCSVLLVPLLHRSLAPDVHFRSRRSEGQRGRTEELFAVLLRRGLAHASEAVVLYGPPWQGAERGVSTCARASHSSASRQRDALVS